MIDEQVEQQAPREFASFLIEHAKGRSHDELSRSLADLVRAVVDTGKPGTLTYTVKVKPTPNVDNMVKTEDAITVKKPELDRPASMYFVTDSGDLTLDHPHQTAMFQVGGER